MLEIKEILFSLWFFLPAGLANAAPVFANKIPAWNRWQTPMDFGLTFRGKRIFGNNKTWRGFISGVIVGCLTAIAQRYGYNHSDFLQDITYLNYSAIHVGALGAMLGAGALIGDAVGSFLKRQVGVPDGQSWFPFDQIDYIVGGLLVSSFVIDMPHYRYWIIFVVWFLVHLLAGVIAYAIGLKKRPI